MATGFHINALRAVSAGDTQAAEIGFKPGGNVVSGASNTGKSYLLDCIDYMFGRQDVPRSIPEATPYTVLYLEIQTLGGETLTLERSLLGGDFRVHRGGLREVGREPAVEYSARKHKGREDSISALLLGVSGLQNRRVLQKVRGETRDLSFRDIAPLVLVDEKRIIQQASPIYSGDTNRTTSEEALLRLLITGADYSAVVARPDPKLERARREGSMEVVEQLLVSIAGQLKEMSLDPQAIPEALGALDRELDALTEHASLAEKELRQGEEQRARAWSLARAVQSRRAAIKELQARFALLEQQYQSDLRRLGATLESEYVFAQLPVEKCPLCGASLPTASHEHDVPEPNPAFADACRGEIRKIEALRAELVKTSEGLALEDAKLVEELRTAEERVAALSSAIADRLQPVRAGTARKMRELAVRRAAMERGATLAAQEEALRQQLGSSGRPHRPEKDEDEARIVVRASTSDTDAFCRVVEGLLRAWRYPGLDRVAFSEPHQDLVISGKDRESQGKGLRAVAYAGFAIGLMRYCRERGLPHPGLVVLDSPLVTYRRPDMSAGEQVPLEVKEAFFDSLTRLRKDEQVIVLENEDPPAAARQAVNWIHFTGAPGLGRQGFYPPAKVPPG